MHHLSLLDLDFGHSSKQFLQAKFLEQWSLTARFLAEQSGSGQGTPKVQWTAIFTSGILLFKHLLKRKIEKDEAKAKPKSMPVSPPSFTTDQIPVQLPLLSLNESGDMNYFIGRDDQQSGPYSEMEVRAMLQIGKISPQDLYWHEGCPRWEALYKSPAFFVQGAVSAVTSEKSSPVGLIKQNEAQSGGNLQIVGYCCIAVGFCFLPLLFGPTGVVLGIVLRRRRCRPHGTIILVASIFNCVCGLLLSM